MGFALKTRDIQYVARATAFWGLTFLLPVAFLCALCAVSDVYPFGSRLFLVDDANYQYIDFFAWFKRVLSGDASVLYSASQSLGANTWGIFSYYLSSPLNLLIVFFDESHLVLFIFTICAIKLGLINVAFTYYLRHRFKSLGAIAMALSLGVALCVWVVTNVRNPMWLDMLIWLPISMLGAYRLVANRRIGMLIFGFAGAVITCWYTAYMVIVFTILYALMELYICTAGRPGFVRKHLLGMLGRGAIAVVAAIALSAFTFVPTVLSMLGDTTQQIPPIPDPPAAQQPVGEALPAAAEQTTDALPPAASNATENEQLERADAAFSAHPGSMVAKIASKIGKAVKGLFTGDYKAGTIFDPPQLFGGTFLIAGALFFFLSRRVRWQTKTALGLFAAFLLASTLFDPLYVFWCDFRAPSGHYCRIGSFFCVALVWASAFALDEGASKERQLPASLLASIISCIPACMLFAFGIIASPLCALTSILAAFGAFLIFGMHLGGEGIWKSALPVAVASVVVLAELFVNAQASWAFVDYESQSDFEDYIQQSRSIQGKISREDDGIFRIAKTYTRAGDNALNEGMAVGYNEISSYSSIHNGDTVRFLSAMGYSRQGDMMVRYGAPLLLMDSLLGVKYVSTDLPAPALERLEYGTYVGKNGNNPLYLNNYALPIAYFASDGVEQFKLDSPGNPFERQNDFVSSVLGRKVKLYTPCDAKLLSRDSRTNASGESFDVEEWEVAVPQGDIGYYYIMESPIKYGQLVPHLYVTVEKENPLSQAWSFRNSVTPLGYSGDERTYKITIETSTLYRPELKPGTTWPIFYSLNMEEFNRCMHDLAADAVEVGRLDDGNIELTVDSATPDSLVMITVPYDSGWSIQINGNQAEPLSLADGAFMGVKVMQGTSEIKLSYMPPGLLVGCAVSALSAIVLIIMFGRRIYKARLAVKGNR